MKIATWNVLSGTSEERASEMSDVDIIAFQETSQTKNNQNCVWRGDEGSRTKGVSIWSPQFEFSIMAPNASCSPGLAVCFKQTPLGDIQILNLWAKPGPDYYDDLMNSLSAYEQFIERGPTIILGDFNISPRLSGKKQKFERLMWTLEEKFGLSSAYHKYFNEDFGCETRPTLYHLKKEDRPFHIDFVFLPRALLPRLKSVTVPNFKAFSASDHRPVICAFE